MAQYSASTEHTTPVVTGIADPVPLGMSAFAFTTAVLGCAYVGFILPGEGAGLSLVVAVALIYGGIVQILVVNWVKSARILR
jgi:succinate-acetate transporter protein